jgi:hypothetical protein
VPGYQIFWTVRHSGLSKTHYNGEKGYTWRWKGYTGHFYTKLLMVLFLLYDVEKSSINAGMPEKSESGIDISTSF